MLNGKTIQEINLQMISSMKEQAGIHSNIVSDVVDAVAEAIHSDEGMEIYTGGATNIFRYPELSENGKASELIQTLEEKQNLVDLVTDTLNKDEKEMCIRDRTQRKKQQKKVQKNKYGNHVDD